MGCKSVSVCQRIFARVRMYIFELKVRSERRLSRMCVYLFMYESVNRNEPANIMAKMSSARTFQSFPHSAGVRIEWRMWGGVRQKYSINLHRLERSVDTRIMSISNIHLLWLI